MFIKSTHKSHFGWMVIYMIQNLVKLNKPLQSNYHLMRGAPMNHNFEIMAKMGDLFFSNFANN